MATRLSESRATSSITKSPTPTRTRWRIVRARSSRSRVISAISASPESSRPSGIRTSSLRRDVSTVRRIRIVAMPSNEILSFDVATLSEHLRAKKISPVEVTKAYLDRIAHIDAKIHTYITVTADDAIDAAKKAESEIAA